MDHSTLPEPPRPRTGARWRLYGFWLVPVALLALSLLTAASGFFVRSEDILPRQGADAEAVPRRGGLFRFPLLVPLTTLDPARARFGSEILLVQQIYDGLTAFDEHLNVIPALAAYWEISADGTTYTFELRSDARFHNGRPVTAADCVFSFERLLRPGLNEDNYHYFSRIVGADAFHRGAADRVRGLRALDEKTFQIEFSTPFVPALSVLAMYSSKILPKDELERAGERFFEAPIGTGPFRFAGWIDEAEDPAVPVYKGVVQGVRLEANRDYFGGPPYLDGVLFRSVLNRRGFDEVPLDERFDACETLAETFRDWVPVETDKLLALNYLVFPNDVPPYDDRRVRRAINYALDKRRFLDSIPYSEGMPAAVGIVPPGIPGYHPAEVSYEHNLEKARRLLAEAGYPGGRGLPPLELPVLRRDPTGAARRECLTACLGKIGVEVRPLPVDRLVRPGDASLRGRPVLLAAPGWIADFPDPDNFLRPLFHSASPVNHVRKTGYSNPKVDGLLDLAWSETSYSARNRLYHKIEKILLYDMPIIPLDHGRSRFLVRPTVRGFTVSPMGSMYIKLNKVWFAPEPPPAEATGS